VLKDGDGAFTVLGVDAGVPLLEVGLNLVVLVAEDLLPAWGNVDVLGGELPVPEAVIRAAEQELVPLLEIACAGLCFLEALKQPPHTLWRVLNGGAPRL